MRVIVLGAGVMGTAFTMPLADNGHDVHLVGTHLDDLYVSGMAQDRIHPRLKATIPDTVHVHAFADIADAFSKPADLLIGGISTPGVRWAVEQFAQHMKGTAPLALLTKGIGAAVDRVQPMPDFVAQLFASHGVAHGPIGAIGGPCIAGELAVRHQTSAIVGFKNRALAKQMSEAISTTYYHLRHTDDLSGLEICAALKNFYAIGVSTAAGLVEIVTSQNGAQQHNMAASLFNQAVSELQQIVVASGGRAETAIGLAGLGDLHVTCQAGRNSKLGKLLGQGMLFADAMSGPLKGETVEGTLVAQSLAKPIAALTEAGVFAQSDLPLARAIVHSVVSNARFEIDLSALHRF
jgi:glycerol-3-phosphate dehydrogenase (NAD(P)+)